MKVKMYTIIILALLVLIGGCSPHNSEIEEETEDEEIIEEEIEEAPGYLCPLTGLTDPEEENIRLRPIAVMIDNEINARPQSGLGSAEIVYEIPVEGSITRYMGIYHHLASEKIGPVRSARPYFIDKALEFNAVYVHCGGSPQALKDLSVMKVDTFNDLKGTPVFWRASDRKMPHNLYTNTKFMREVTETKKIENKIAPEYFKFSEEYYTPDGPPINKVTINYGGYYKISFLYNNEEKEYFRYINGDLMKDNETKENIKTSNIIIEIVTMKVLDNVGRLQLNNIGKNRGYFLTGGRLIEIGWQKDSRNGKTTYRDLSGNEILLNKGVSWIQIVSPNTKIEFEE